MQMPMNNFQKFSAKILQANTFLALNKINQQYQEISRIVNIQADRNINSFAEVKERKNNTDVSRRKKQKSVKWNT